MVYLKIKFHDNEAGKLRTMALPVEKDGKAISLPAKETVDKILGHRFQNPELVSVEIKEVQR